MGVQPEASLPCDGLTPSQHHTLYVLSHQARGKQRRVGPLDYEELARKIHGSARGWKYSRDDVVALKEEGYIEHQGDLHFLVQQTCCCAPENFSGGNESIGRFPPPEPLGSGVAVNDRREEPKRSDGFGGGSASEGVRRRPSNADDHTRGLAGTDVLTNPEWDTSVPGAARRPRSVDELARDYFPVRCEEAGIRYGSSEQRYLRNKMAYWMRHGESLDRLICMVDQFVRHPQWCRRSTKPTSVVFVMHHANLIDLVNTYEAKNASKAHRHDRDFWLPAFMRNAKRIQVR